MMGALALFQKYFNLYLPTMVLLKRKGTTILFTTYIAYWLYHCITPDNILEVLVYAHNENFLELLELEQNYTGDIFNDAALDLEICSIEV